MSNYQEQPCPSALAHSTFFKSGWQERQMMEEMWKLLFHSVASDSLRPHGLQHTRPPCSSSTPRVYSKSCPLSRWCHPTISFSVIRFSSCLQPFPASGSFQISQLFTSEWWSIGASASASVLPIFKIDFLNNSLAWYPCYPRVSQEFSPTPQFKSIILQHSAFYMVQL